MDYLLKDYGLNLAIIEAKKYSLPVTDWLEQVKDYGRKLWVRRVYSTNGQEIYERDMEEWLGKLVDKFPSPTELYERYTDEYATLRQQLLSVPYYIDSSKKPRYYQDLAITKALSAIAAWQERVLLTLATGTGKTYIAFQLTYKLLQAKWSRTGFNRSPRILFLADRNILIEQAINTFNPLEKDCVRVRWANIQKNLGRVPTNANIFFSIYQAIIAGSDEEEDDVKLLTPNPSPLRDEGSSNWDTVIARTQDEAIYDTMDRHADARDDKSTVIANDSEAIYNTANQATVEDPETSSGWQLHSTGWQELRHSGLDPESYTVKDPELNSGWQSVWYYRQYDPDFFDLIIIDECHRGGARSDGNRAEILHYFSWAVQLGMTATPKRDDNIDTYGYFWEPVYEYSLKEWINDGFLTPYKVKRIQTNIDELVIDDRVEILWGDQDKDLYEIKDFDRSIIVPERNDLIARTILEQIHPNDKTIVFCVDQEHAANLRDAINSYKQVRDADYCVRVTSNEWDIGRAYLERFQDNSKTIPTILTSSQMLTTWVDAKNIRNIVLLRNIGSMTEFKQIIWRGTRVFDGKDYFTIIDFTWATNLFYDPDWDGEQLEVVEDEENTEDVIANDSEAIHDDMDRHADARDDLPKKQKLRVKLSDERELRIINIETRYIDESGKPLTAEEYLRKLVGQLPALYESESQLRTLRADPKTRESLLSQLQSIWLDTEQFKTLQMMFDAPDSDIFDILTHLSYGEDLKTRSQRVHRVLSQWLIARTDNLSAKDFLDYLLRYYEQYGSTELIQSKMGEIIKLYGSGKINVVDFTQAVGGAGELMKSWIEVQKELFRI